MHVRTLILATAAIGLAACTQTAQTASMTPGEGRDCFNTNSVSGYEVIDDNNIRVRVGVSRSYTLHTSWNANDLDWTNVLALRSATGWICTGNVRGAVEVSGGREPVRTYPIDTVTRDPDPPGQEGS